MLAAAAIVFLFATNSQVVWLYLIVALIGGLALIGTLGPAVAVRRVRPVLRGWRREGFVPPLPQDRGRLFAGDQLILRLDLGDERPPVEMPALRDATQGNLPATSTIDGREAAVAIAAERRGRLRLSAVLVQSSWPLGIARAQRWSPLEFTVVVHPRYALPASERRRGRRDPVGAAATRGPGDEFLGLREYHSGDSQRRIHWPTSARIGTLMVVETAQESSSSAIYELRLEAGSERNAELAVGIAASLGAGNVAEGIALTMAVPGQPRAVVRWAEVLGALALADPGAATVAPGGRDAVRISAAPDGVTVARGPASAIVDPRLTLADALTTLRDLE